MNGMRSNLWFVILLFVLTCSVQDAFGQSKRQESQDLYFEATTSYQESDYNKVFDLLSQAELIGGGSNAYIQALRIKCYVAQEEWDNAKNELNQSRHYKIPDRKKEEFNTLSNQINSHFLKLESEKISELKKEKEINVKASRSKFRELTIQQDKIDNEDEVYQKAVVSISETLLERYLQSYPGGKYIAEANQLILERKDRNGWNRAVVTHKTEGYLHYLKIFPHGKHINEAQEAIERLDKVAYEVAIASGTAVALKSYLSDYPEGKFREDVMLRLEERMEYDAYLEAKASTRKATCDNNDSYITKYPNGKYADEVNEWRGNCYYFRGNEASNRQDWNEAELKYLGYIERYPEGEYAPIISLNLIKIFKKTGRKNSPLYHYFTGKNYANTNDNVNAKKVFITLIDEGISELDTDKQVDVYTSVAYFYHDEKNIDEGIEIITQAKSKFPNQLDILVCEAFLYQNSNNIIELKKVLKKILLVEPAYTNSYLLLGKIYSKENDFKQAQYYCEELLKREPNNPKQT